MKMMKKPFRSSCGNDIHFIWKARGAKPLKITTIFADLRLPRMQAQCKRCGKKMFISRALLGMEKYQKMSSTTQKMLALTGVSDAISCCGENSWHVRHRLQSDESLALCSEGREDDGF